MLFLRHKYLIDKYSKGYRYWLIFKLQSALTLNYNIIKIGNGVAMQRIVFTETGDIAVKDIYSSGRLPDHKEKNVSISYPALLSMEGYSITCRINI